MPFLAKWQKNHINKIFVLPLYYYKLQTIFIYILQESYFGDYRIYCITAVSQQPATVNSTVEVIGGGLNHTFVTFEMKSIVNFGFEYILNVYVNKTVRFDIK